MELLATFEFRAEAEEFIDAGEAVVVVTRQTARGAGERCGGHRSDCHRAGTSSGEVTYFDAYRTKAEALEAVGLRE